MEQDRGDECARGAQREEERRAAAQQDEERRRRLGGMRMTGERREIGMKIIGNKEHRKMLTRGRGTMLIITTITNASR